MTLLYDLILILALSALVLYICHRVKLPALVGYLLTGMISGPYGLGLIHEIQAVKVLAEVGIVLLLFTIGLEFSFRSLLRIRKPVLLGGSLQVLLTICIASGIAYALKLSPGESLFIGFLVSLSSTAIVMKIFQDRAEVETPHGNIALGILIFQDLIIIPMMLLIPLLSGREMAGGWALVISLAQGIGVLLFVLVSTKWVAPKVLFKVAQTESRELFLLSVVVMCLAVAWLTHSLGLSLALGAFLAGLILSESEYSHQALGHILPFRDIFTGFFFISVGMLLDIRFLFAHPLIPLLAGGSILLLKSLLAGLAAAAVGLPLRTVVLVGLSLGQVGEFSFILSESGQRYGLVTGEHYQIFLAVAILTMMATPFVLMVSPGLADLALKLPLPRRIKRGSYPVALSRRIHEKDHLILVGYGLSGRNLARAAKGGGIPYAIIEMNPAVVREEREKGEPIYFGDATQEAILQHVNLKEARAVVVVINDPSATRRVVELVRRMNPRVYLIVRTRFLQEMKPLLNLGADEVVPEEFETSVEIFSRVLTKYLLPKEEIERYISEIRAGEYGMLRSISREATSCLDLELCLPGVEIKSFRVEEGSPLIGKRLSETELRSRYGLTVLAIRRKGHILSNPDPETQFRSQDILFVVGKTEQIDEAVGRFKGF